MNKPVMFSIIIPVYNTAKYLSRCIDSILRQSVDDFEMILINDGSTDNSGELCEMYKKKDSRIEVFHTENKGVSSARNLGLEKANGEWIIFIDSDDWIDQDLLDALVRKIDIFGLDLYTYGYRRINDNTTEYVYQPIYTVENNEEFIKSRYYKHAGCAYAYNNSLIKKYNIKFPENQKYSEDQAFLLKYISRCEKVVLLNKVLYNYYDSPTSAVNKPISIHSSICNIWAANDFLEYSKSNNIPESFYAHPVKQLYDDFFMYLSMIPDVNKREAQKEYKKGYKETLRLYPAFQKYRYYKIAYNNLSLPQTLLQRKNKLKNIKNKFNIFSKLKQIIHNTLYIDQIVRGIVYDEIQRDKDITKIERYKYLAEESDKIGITTEKHFDNEIIVSLTSYGRRIHEVYLTIESIMRQTVKPNKIILWLAEDEFTTDTIPVSLKRLEKRGLTIGFCEDIKSYKKLVPALRKYPDDIIITVDDDVLYNYDLIENLMNSYKKNPKVIHFCRGSRIKIHEDGSLYGYTQWDSPVKDSYINKLNFPTGVGGILYPPDCFHKDVTNEKLFMTLCPTADDVWFKAMSLLKMTYAKKVYTQNIKGVDYTILNNDMQSETALWNINVTKNDEQIKAVFSKYDIYKLLK